MNVNLGCIAVMLMQLAIMKREVLAVFAFWDSQEVVKLEIAVSN